MESNTDKALEAVKQGAGAAADYAGATASKVASAVRAKVAELAATSPSASADDYLHGWNNTPTRAAIVGFVEAVTTEGGSDFIPVAERIAVFDNDGTLWCEHPIYIQLQFAIDRFREIGATKPELQSDPVFTAVESGDIDRLAAIGKQGLVKILAETHAGMTTDEFAGVVEKWMDTARHPRFGLPYTECIYAPMRQMLDYLRANHFKTFIVSGGGVDFMRVFAEKTYGIPPEQVIGSSGETTYEVRDGVPVLVKQPKIDFIDDKEGKPVGINRFIGRRPVIAFGNSDGDFQMLEYTTAAAGKRLGLFVHHDDADREYAYERDELIGTLDRALKDADQRGWIVISMKDDWNTVFVS